MSTHQVPNVRALVAVDAYLAERREVFPSRESWRWFERRNRQALLQAGAILAPTGKKLIDPVAVDAVVLRIGQQRACELAGRP